MAACMRSYLFIYLFPTLVWVARALAYICKYTHKIQEKQPTHPLGGSGGGGGRQSDGIYSNSTSLIFQGIPAQINKHIKGCRLVRGSNYRATRESERASCALAVLSAARKMHQFYSHLAYSQSFARRDLIASFREAAVIMAAGSLRKTKPAADFLLLVTQLDLYDSQRLRPPSVQTPM
jgi:hypothetical protein